MTVNQELLDILCCPKTKVPVERFPEEKIKDLNALIQDGKALYADGVKVDETVSEALITEDKKTIYRVDDGIPIMLIDKGIPTENLKLQI